MTTVDSEVTGILRRAFDVLDTFGPGRQTLSLSDIARRSGLPKTTVHRVLRQMESIGAVDRVGRRYRVGTRIFVLGSRGQEAAIRAAALPHMTELNRRFGHTLHLATLAGPDVLYLEKLSSRATAPSPSVVGGCLPAHCTAVGKVMLAWQPPESLDDLGMGCLAERTGASITSGRRLLASLRVIRERRVAVDNEEAAEGLRCVAAPIILGERAVAAMSIAYSASVALPNDRVFALQETAARISRGLARTPNYLTALSAG
jgi:DNA-binding IclR family transcriptional regulator